MAIDISKEIRRAVDSGKVFFGTRSVEKKLLTDKGKLVILTKNMPVLEKEKISYLAEVAETPFFAFEGSSKELGNVCGKPFVISSMLVADVGKSGILTALKDNEKEKAEPESVKRAAKSKAKKSKKKEHSETDES
ncbi:MAG: 50S ribosomal protein L30e [Candidatus Diapherotrites archaeon]|nr:50S ribosomal protein L30e [Candidatus Diapherotrites archaeon]